MVASVEFTEFLKELLAPLGAVSVRRMFGKSGVFIEGVMLGMVRDNTLYLRVDALNQAFFQEAASSPPLNYEKRGEMIDLSFWRLPDRLLDEPDEFVAWARSALGAAHRVASKRQPSKKEPGQLRGKK